MIRCRHLTVEREGRRLLDDISLDLKAGEHWAVWGENGAGKTTLARVLAGFAPPGAGELSWDAALDPPLPLLFQDADAQIAAATVRDELALGARAEGEPAITREDPGPAGRRLARAMREFRLEDFARRNPHSLSGGEKRRVNLASLAVLESPVLILDEPELHLDGRSIEEWTAVLHDWEAAGERCVLEITHDPARAMRADHLAVLDEGRLLAAGPTQEVRDELDGLDLPLPWNATSGSQPKFESEQEELKKQARRLLVEHGERTLALDAEDLTLERPGSGPPVLDRVSLQLETLDRVLLRGQNGCGKTSLLLVLAGLADPDGGSVAHHGVRETGPHVVMSFQEPERGCFAETVAQELSFGLRRHGIGKAESDLRAAKILASFDLAPEDYLARDPFRLSEGELRRVALASVLVMAPRILFLDEPAASLDWRGRALLRRALEGFGGALVWADHSLPAGFEDFFDRQWLLTDGRLVEEK